jgi:hypothetical protein
MCCIGSGTKIASGSILTNCSSIPNRSSIPIRKSVDNFLYSKPGVGFHPPGAVVDSSRQLD